jgi:fatty acid desaturase
MHRLFALQVTLMTLTATLADTVRAGAAARRQQLRQTDRQAGLSTLEIAIIALGLFLIAGVAVLALTTATNNRLNQIQ